jgi:hypothetical protein
MTPFLVLAAWNAIGLLLAVRLAQPHEHRLAWAPIAVILGPLWAPVAIDRRRISEDQTARRLR